MDVSGELLIQSLILSLHFSNLKVKTIFQNQYLVPSHCMVQNTGSKICGMRHGLSLVSMNEKSLKFYVCSLWILFQAGNSGNMYSL